MCLNDLHAEAKKKVKQGSNEAMTKILYSGTICVEESSNIVVFAFTFVSKVCAVEWRFGMYS
jgi:hypothetical protein